MLGRGLGQEHFYSSSLIKISLSLQEQYTFWLFCFASLTKQLKRSCDAPRIRISPTRATCPAGQVPALAFKSLAALQNNSCPNLDALNFFVLCWGEDLNLHSLRNLLLRQARLPISPPQHKSKAWAGIGHEFLIHFVHKNSRPRLAVLRQAQDMLRLSIPARKPRRRLAPGLKCMSKKLRHTFEAWAGIEPAHGSFADSSVTTSPPGQCPLL